MDIDLFDRLNEIASVDRRQYMIIKNPFTDHEQIFIVESFKPANNNINPYNDLHGKDITKLIDKQYMRFFTENRFNSELWKQEVSMLQSESLTFPNTFYWQTIVKNI